MWLAERVATPETAPSATSACATRSLIGLAQAVALIPGVSRSGATISVGLFRGLDRVTATRLSFFMSIPALVAAGLFELKDAFSGDIGAGQAIVGIVVAFVVAYASIAWLLRFVAHHSIAWFVPYRVGARRAAAGAARHRRAQRRPEPAALQPAGLLEQRPQRPGRAAPSAASANG